MKDSQRMELEAPAVANERFLAIDSSNLRPGPPPVGDMEAAYSTFRRGLLGFLSRNVNEPSLAEDLLHEVFVKATRALERGERPNNLSAWLYRIARNTLIDHVRRERTVEALPDNLEADGPFNLPPEQTLALCLKPFIQELPEKYRAVLLATAIEGRSLADWARDVGLSPSAAKSRASRGRAMLRDKVLDCCHVEVARTGEVLDYHRRS